MLGKRIWAAIAVTLTAFTAAATLSGGTAVAGSTSLFAGPRSVSCPTPTTCFAAGGGDPYNRVNPTVYRRVGNHWNASKVPLPAGLYGTLDAISCPTATSCVAVGVVDLIPGPSNNYGTLIARWNGTKWRTSTSPLTFGSVFVFHTRIECPVSTAMCWVFNSDSGPAVHLGLLTPGGLSAKTFALPSGWTNFSATDMSCTPKACMLVGGVASVANGSGHGISYLLTGTNARFLLTPEIGTSSVECLSATNCVGSSSNDLSQTWDGTRWTYVPLKNIPGNYGGPILIGCRTNTNCLAYGSHYDYPNNPDVTVADLIRINDSTLTASRIPGNTLYPNPISGDCSPDQSSCAIVGDKTVSAPNGESVADPLFLHFAGGRWTLDS